MKNLIIIVMCLTICGLSSCSQGQKSSNNETTKTTTDTSKPKTEKPKTDPLAAGKRTYNTYCLTCHGQNGNMGASGAHDLTKTALSFAETVTVITEGRGLMTPHKFLGKDKINAVAKYIETFKVN